MKSRIKGLSKVIDSSKADAVPFQDYKTDPELFDWLDVIFDFTCDACASPDNALCEKFWTKEVDCRTQDWSNDCIFCNPPFCDLPTILDKAKTARLAVVICIGSTFPREYFLRSPADYIFTMGAIFFISPITNAFMKTPYPTGCFLSIYGKLSAMQIVLLKQKGQLYEKSILA